MKVHLFDFQEAALISLRTKVHQARTFASPSNPQVVVFSAPTGSGKTVMMTALFEDILMGAPAPDIKGGVFEAQPDAVILWVSDSPELNEQSRIRIEQMSQHIDLNHLQTIESNFDRHRLEGGNIYFINIQKLGNASLLTKLGDGRQHTIWQTLTHTAQALPDRFYVVIDEAHRGMNIRGGARQEAQTLMQRFLVGHPETGLVKMPLVIGISATPQRFQDLLTSANAGHDVKQVQIQPAEVRDSGLLKDRILIHHPAHPTSMEFALLQEAASRWAKIASAWKAYSEAEEEPLVCPVLVVQVENGAGKQITQTDLATAIAAIEKGIGRSLEPLEPVHALHDQGDLIIGGRRIRKVDASRIQDDLHVGVVFFKTSLSTGWDCPRAEVMMSFRRAEDHTHIAQLLGRMVRTPLARRIQRDAALNDVHLFLPHFNAAAVQGVINALQNVEDAPPTETGSSQELVVLQRRAGTELLFQALDKTTTYRVDGFRAQSDIRRYIGLARGLTLDGLAPEAWDNAKKQVVFWLGTALAALEADGTFQGAVQTLSEALVQVQAATQVLGAAETVESYTVEAADADIERFFEEAGQRLGNGLHKAYWDTHAGRDPRQVKLEAAVLSRHSTSMDGLVAKCAEAFNELYDQHKNAIHDLKESKRAYYERWRRASAQPVDVAWQLPDTIDFRRMPTDPPYDRHLYLEDDGSFRTDLKTWEREVLEQELADPAVLGWLRNCVHKSWSLEIPYTIGGTIKPMFPDLVLVRQVGENLRVDVLEPHNPSLADNCDKARGLAAFAKQHGHQFGRIELIRKLRSAAGTEQYYRLDMNKTGTQEKVLQITTNAQLDQLFEELV